MSRPSPSRQRAAWLLGAVLVATLGLPGCATVGATSVGPPKRVDPWESWNRKVFAFNENLDAKVLHPLATGYVNVVPQFMRTGVDNFFNNAADAWSAVNNLLQGKGEPAFQDLVRVTTNTTIGFFGLLDWASQFGLEHHYQDFGQTLGRWGFAPGAYVVWPLFGSSTVRDSVGLPLDVAASPALFISGGTFSTVKLSLDALHIVNTRADFLGATKLLDEIALDKYQFVRDAYLQRRHSLVYGSDGPEDPDPGDTMDAPDAPDASASASSPASAPASRPAPAPGPAASGASAP